MGEGQLAAVEFRKLVDHPGRVVREVIGGAVTSQLARAQKMMADQAAAASRMRTF